MKEYDPFEGRYIGVSKPIERDGMIYHYEFADGEIYKLKDAGFSSSDIFALNKIHGELKIKKVERMG